MDMSFSCYHQLPASNNTSQKGHSRMLTHFDLLVLLKRINIKIIRNTLHRQRLKYSLSSLAFYVECILQHNHEQKTFKALYKRLYSSGKLTIHYSAFMSNIQTVAPLMRLLFQQYNTDHLIHASSLWNAVDSTLIEEKQEAFINQKDWDEGRVTTRGKGTSKHHICGAKGLCFINRQHLVYCAEFLTINTSDHNILKSSCHFNTQLKGFMLADRGFSNKRVRQRLACDKNDIWHADYIRCRLISPYVKTSKQQLSDKEKRIYRKRWSIETLFQKVKDVYSQTPLQLHGRYTSMLKQAKFFATWLYYNDTILAV